MQRVNDERCESLIAQIDDKIRSSTERVSRAKQDYDEQILTERVNNLTDEIKNNSFSLHPPPVFPFRQQVDDLRAEIAGLERGSGRKLDDLSAKLSRA
eukprot:57698-Hanusia_phi.AAC.1